MRSNQRSIVDQHDTFWCAHSTYTACLGQWLQKPDIALGRAIDGVFSARAHPATVPRAIDAFERERPHALGDAANRGGGQWNEVRIAVHEAEIPPVHDDRERVADQQ